MSDNTLTPGEPARATHERQGVCEGVDAVGIGRYPNTHDVLARESDHGQVVPLRRDVLQAQPPPLAA